MRYTVSLMSVWDWLGMMTAGEVLTVLGTWLAAAATTAAVWVSVSTARRARKDAAEERLRADRAESALAKAQLDGSAIIAETHRSIERDRTLYALRADAEQRAREQAVDIRVQTRWHPLFGGATEISGDLHAHIGAVVVNGSKSTITDISVAFDRMWGQDPRVPSSKDHEVVWTAPILAAGDSVQFDREPVYVFGHGLLGALPFVTLFTDAHGHRWRLDPDHTLTLLNLRLVRVADQEGPHL